MVYYLLFLDAGIKRYEFLKIWIKSDFKILFESYFNSGADTWQLLIGAYRFGWIRPEGRLI
jgi:hypothetical protein